MTAMVPSDTQITLVINTVMDDLHRHDYEIQEKMWDPIAFLSTINEERDKVYYHVAVKQHNSEHFITAIVKEFNNHVKQKHWLLINKEDVPQGTKVIPSV